MIKQATPEQIVAFLTRTPMRDIVERLRNRNNPENRWVMMNEAADLIERLRVELTVNGVAAFEVHEQDQAEIERLRTALRDIERNTGPTMLATNHGRRGDIAHGIARRALESKP
jgi:hypothetical protein